MQKQSPAQSAINAKILLQQPNIVMHRFIKNQKSFISSGILKIASINNQHHLIYFINFNSFYFTLNKQIIFAKIQYQDTISYLFVHFDQGINSFTFIKNQINIHNFQQAISNIATLYPFAQALENHQFNQKIKQHCEGVQKQAIYSSDKIKSAIKQVGKILGVTLNTLGDYVAQGVNYVGQYLDKKIQQPQHKTQVPSSTKQKWQHLKQGTSSVLNISKQLYNKYLSYYVDAGIGYGKQVTNQIENSNYSTVKYAVQLASVSSKAIGQAFEGLSQGVSKVNTQLGTHSRNLVQKKYGEDYVKTFLPQQENPKKQESSQHDEEKKQTQVHEQKKQSQVHEENKQTELHQHKKQTEKHTQKKQIEDEEKQLIPELEQPQVHEEKIQSQKHQEKIQTKIHQEKKQTHEHEENHESKKQ